MGGSVGKTLDPTGGHFLGTSGGVSNVFGDIATGGLAAVGQRNPLQGPWGSGPTNPFGTKSFGEMMGLSQPNNPYVSGPFSLDPNQLAADQAAIAELGKTQSGAASDLGALLAGGTTDLGNTLGRQTTDLGNEFNVETSGLGSTLAGQTTGLGQDQYDQILKQIPTTVGHQLQQEMPAIAESANAGGVLTSSAYPQEIARQQAYLTQNLELPAMERLQQSQRAGLQQSQGAAQVGLGQKQQFAQAGLGQTQSALQQALAQKQGGQQTASNLLTQFGQAGLGRQLSLEDFINQANVAKTIGAQTAPQVGNGKGQTGTLLQGVGSLAPIAGMMMGGPAGAAAGAGLGAATSGKGSSGGGGGVTGNPSLSLFNNGSSGYARYPR